VTFDDANRKMANNNSMTSECNRQENLTVQMLNLGDVFLPTISSKEPENNLIPLTTSYPDRFDVREKFGNLCPRINRVYNQGQCKSGWVNYKLFDFLIVREDGCIVQ